MEAQPPPHPEYRSQESAVPARDYRVVFWQQQLPPEGSGISPEEMGWSELTFDLVGAEDVQDAIAWAESNIDDVLDEVNRAWAEMHPDDGVDEASRDEQRSERLYVLYVRVPNEDSPLKTALRRLLGVRTGAQLARHLFTFDERRPRMPERLRARGLLDPLDRVAPRGFP